MTALLRTIWPATTGTTVGTAVEALDTAKRLCELPATAAAALSGALSPQQAAAISTAAVADPSAEARLLAKAKRVSLTELRDECARTAAAALPDAEARRQRIHASRHLRERTDAEGAWMLSVRNLPEGPGLNYLREKTRLGMPRTTANTASS